MADPQLATGNCGSVYAAPLAGWLLVAACCLPTTFAVAHVVPLDIDLPLDQVAPGKPFKVGDHHRARIFYDDAAVNPKTHVVRVLHMQHLLGRGSWEPKRLDALAMPMSDAWLDLSRVPYRYHYSAAVIQGGEAIMVDFDDQTRRLTIRLQSDQSVIISAPYTVDPNPVNDVDTAAIFQRPPAYVMHDMDVAIDQVAPGERSRVGDHDKIRVVYDDSAIDPKSRRVKLLNMQHFIGGGYQPAHPDSVFMPMTDAWLDLSVAPYAMHFRANVVHGKPILIEVNEQTRRLSVRSQSDPGQILLSGLYLIDPRPITGPEAEAAATAAP
jgi:hypothetical protein